MPASPEVGVPQEAGGAELGAPPAAVVAPRVGQWPIKGLFVFALVVALHLGKAVLLPIALALLLQFLLSPAVRGLRAWRIPEVAGAGGILLVFLLLIGTALYHVADPAMKWLQRAPQAFSTAEYKIRELKKTMREMKRATDKVESLTSIGGAPRDQVVVKDEADLSTQLLDNAHHFIIATVSTVILTFFLLASGDSFLRRIVNVTPRLRDKVRAVEVARGIQREIGRYFLVISSINLGLGVATSILMYLLGLPNAPLWGVMVAVLNFIPYVGPLTSLTVLTGAALLSFDTLAQVWPVPVSFAVLTFVEGQLMQPLLAGRYLSINPVVIFVTLMFWGWIWGLPGMLIAVPMLIVFKLICDHAPGLQHIAVFLGRD